MSETDQPGAIAEQDASGPAGGLSPVTLFLIGLVFLAAVYIAVKGLRPGEPMGVRHPSVGKTLASFAAPPLDSQSGPPLSLADLQGQVALIDYWGPWCPPCREELPHLLALARARTGKNFRLVLVSGWGVPDRDEAELAASSRRMVDPLARNMPLYADPKFTNRMALLKSAALDDFAYPTTVLLDGAGVIRGLWVGYRERQEEEIAAAVDELLPH